MPPIPIHALMVEDNPGDARLIQEMLLDAGDSSVKLDCVERLDAGIEVLSGQPIDVVLLDLSLPDSQGFETFHTLYAKVPDIPIIVMSGFDETELAVKAVREGAQDYLVKGEVTGHLLVRSLRYAIERKHSEVKVHHQYQTLSSLVKINRDIAMLLDQETLLKKIATEAGRLLGMESVSFRLLKGDSLHLMSSVGEKESTSPSIRVGGSLAGTIIGENRVLAIKNLLQDPAIRESRRKKLTTRGYRSFLGAPLQVAGKPVGIIMLYTKTEREFTQSDIDLITAFADQAAIALENSRLYEQVQRRTQELSSLVKINRDIATLLDRQALLPRIAEEARSLLRMDTAHFRLVEGDALVLVSSAGPDLIPRSKVSPTEAVPGVVLTEKRVIAIANIQEEASLSEERRERLKKAGYHAFLAAPLLIKGRAIGLVSLYAHVEREFSAGDIELITSFADLAAIAFNNSQLYEETQQQSILLEQDIAQRKLAESRLKQVVADLNRSNEELKSAQLQLIQAAKLESIGRLAAGVAHEVKNPLEIILMSVEYLSKHAAKGNKQTQMLLDDIEYAVRRADSVVRGLLDFSASDEISTDVQDFNAIVEGATFLVKHQLDREHIAMVKKLGDKLPLVSLDRNKIQQVLVNLFMNAIHAMPGGGILTVRTYAKRLGSIDALGHHSSTNQFKIGDTVVVVEVEDTGTGIPEEQLSKVFDPFFTTKPTGKGTGLGLSVTKKIIELHRGIIHISNREEGGARVTIMFKEHKMEEI